MIRVGQKRKRTEDGPASACQQYNEKLLLPAEAAAIYPSIAHNGSHEDIGPFLISSRVDFCNSIFYGATNAVLRRLQSVLNAAARLITNTRKFYHITPVLRDQLHWLPIRQRIIFKIATFVRNSLHGRGRTYLSRSCIPISEIWARAHLRSAARGQLNAPRPGHVASGQEASVSPDRPCETSCPLQIWKLSLEHFKTGLKLIYFIWHMPSSAHSAYVTRLRGA